MKTKSIFTLMAAFVILLTSCNHNSDTYKGPSHIDIPDYILEEYSGWDYLLEEPVIIHGTGYVKALMFDYEAINTKIIEDMKEKPGVVGLQLYGYFLDSDFIYFSGYANKATVNSDGTFALHGGKVIPQNQTQDYIYEKDHSIQNDWIYVKSSHNGSSTKQTDFDQNQLDISVDDNDTGKPRRFRIDLSKMNIGTSYEVYQAAK